MTDRELVPTQSGFLELKAERAGMREGYRFLDEKRLILAAEILANLKDYDATRARWRRLEASAREALRAAVGRHGLDELSIYPPAAADCRLATQRRSVLGVRIEALPPADPETADAPAATAPDAPDAAGHGPSRPNPPANQSPEADVCRAAFADLLPVAARLAVLTGNLERLRGEYVRTSRRARALEDVLLPEMDARLAAIDNALEELEREEAVRVRRPRS
jgi:V/A-type H+-transporting ATPase subunit D